jgi:hypothetical protein
VEKIILNQPAQPMKTQKEILKWLQANLGRRCTAPLTSTDCYALVTSVNLCNLISHSSAPPELFAAYGVIIRQMQPHTRGLAYHAIACELDWPHRNMIWELARLPADDKPKYKCSFEQKSYAVTP